DPLHRPRRPLRDRVLHPQVHLSRGLDSEPRRGDRGDGASGTRSARRRESAPALRAYARRLGRALRRELGQDPRARPEALRRALPPHLAYLPLVLRGDVPRQDWPHAPVPGAGEQGQHQLELSDEPGVPVPGESRRVELTCWSRTPKRSLRCKPSRASEGLRAPGSPRKPRTSFATGPSARRRASISSTLTAY